MRNFGAGLIALAIKTGPKFVAIFGKLAKGLKVGKVGLAAASVGAYSWMFTWQFALVICFMLFVHESGHVWAMKRCGIKTRGFYFIPFVGGAAIAEEDFPSRKVEVYVAIMGPIWGLALSALTGVIYMMTGHPFFAAAASWMALINLFNLLPINPLDGGRIFKSVAYSLHSQLGFIFLIIGLALTVVGFLYLKMGLFLLLLIVGAIELLFEYRRYKRSGFVIKLLTVMRDSGDALTREQRLDLIDDKLLKNRDSNILVEYEDRRVTYEEAVMKARKTAGWVPPLVGTEIGSAVASYFIVFLLLWIVMSITASVPGADLAMELLQG